MFFSRLTTNFLIENNICPEKIKNILKEHNQRNKYTKENNKEDLSEIKFKNAADVLYWATKDYYK